jgi:hypothetical protein
MSAAPVDDLWAGGTWLEQPPETGEGDTFEFRVNAEIARREVRAEADRRMAVQSDVSGEYLTRGALNDLPVVSPLIDGGVLNRHSYIVLNGRDSSYKSTVAIDWSGCLATGKAWQGHDVERVRVMYIAGEGIFGFAQRIAAWEAAWRTEIEDDWLTIRQSAVNLYRQGADVDELVERVSADGYGLVVVDTLSWASAGADTNGSDMALVVESIDRIRRATDAGSVLLIAHTGKVDDDTRGYSGIEDDADIVWHSKEIDGLITLTHKKAKDTPRHAPITLRPKPFAGSVVIEVGHPEWADENPESVKALLTVMRTSFSQTSATTSELLEATGLPKSSCYRAIDRALETGQLTNVGTARARRLALPIPTAFPSPIPTETDTEWDEP